MIYRIDGELRLEIPDSIIDGIEEKGLVSEPPFYYFLKKRINSDLADELSAMKAILIEIKERGISKNPTVLEAMAGAGFITALILRYLSPKVAVLNDPSEFCCSILEHNYSVNGYRITNDDALSIKVDSALRLDIAVIDFNIFTVRSIKNWLHPLQEIGKKTDYLIVTDSACYGFKFGDRNFAAYGIKSRQEYYYLLLRKLHEVTGCGVFAVCEFRNASIVALQTGVEPDAEIKFLDKDAVVIDPEKPRQGMFF